MVYLYENVPEEFKVINDQVGLSHNPVEAPNVLVLELSVGLIQEVPNSLGPSQDAPDGVGTKGKGPWVLLQTQ